MYKEKTRKKRKAQHEIVGFILIVVIVVVIGLFLLVFYLRQEPVRHESKEVSGFLQASMLYTTECMISEPEYDDLEDLIKSCYENRKCLNDKMACDLLGGIFSELVHESWLVSPDKPVNAYFLEIYYEEDGEHGEDDREEHREEIARQEILSLQEGNCTGSRTGAEYFLHHAPGNIIISMEICYT